MCNNRDDNIALKYGAYSSFKTDAEPSLTEYYGESPRDEVERLLSIYTKSDCKMLDIGCGAGHTMRNFSPRDKNSGE